MNRISSLLLSFTRGFHSYFDIAASRRVIDRSLANSGQQEDALAIYDDWKVVGDDLRKVMG